MFFRAVVFPMATYVYIGYHVMALCALRFPGILSVFFR